MTVFQERTDAYVELFSIYVSEHPEWTAFEFVVQTDEDQCQAVAQALAGKFEGMTFAVGPIPSPTHLRMMSEAGWFEDPEHDCDPTVCCRECCRHATPHRNCVLR